MLNPLDFRAKVVDLEPGLGRRVVSVNKKLYSTLSLSSQVYKCLSIGEKLLGIQAHADLITSMHSNFLANQGKFVAESLLRMRMFASLAAQETFVTHANFASQT